MAFDTSAKAWGYTDSSSGTDFSLQDCEFMETEDWPLMDPNLNVTSAPEQLDIASESHLSPKHNKSVPMQSSEEPNASLFELVTVDLNTELSYLNPKESCELPDALHCFLTSFDPSFGAPMTTVRQAGPATVTLIKPALQQTDQELLQELYREEPFATKGSEAPSTAKEFGKCSAPQFRLSQAPTDETVTVSVPNLPLFEPLGAMKSEAQTPAFDLLSPTDSADTGFTFASMLDVDEDTVSAGVSESSVSSDREADIDRKANYIREVIEKRNDKPDDMSSKLKVHEVILVILLNAAHGDRSKDLQRILTFCDENGREATSGDCRHFKTLDTETMGLLWQKIKGNKKGNYDTFARAMRVRRERSEGFFEYLDAGKGKKKRIYRFGHRSMEEMSRFRKTLRQVSKPQTCSY